MSLERLTPLIDKAYGKSLTGFDYGEVQKSLKADTERKRAEIKSMFDVTANLDAMSGAAVRGMVKEIEEGIKTNKLKVDDVEFAAQRAKLREVANALKQAQDLRVKVTNAYIEDPTKFLFMGGEEGMQFDEGIEGFNRGMVDLAQKKFKKPEDFIQAQAEIFSKVQPKIDEKGFDQSVRQVVESKIKYAMDNADPSGATKEVRLGSRIFRHVPVKLAGAIDDAKQEITQMYPNAVNQIAAQERSRGRRAGEEFEKTNVELFEERLEKMFPQELLKQYEIPQFAPQSQKEPKRTGPTDEELNAAKGVKQAVADAQAGDITKFNKYLAGFGHEAKIDGSGNLVISKVGPSKTEDERITHRIQINDAEQLYDAISAINKNIKRAAIDADSEPSYVAGGETPAQMQQRIKTEKTESQLHKVFEAAGNPKERTLSESVSDDSPLAGLNNKEAVKKYLESISGVKIKESMGYLSEIIIDGVSYDFTNEESRKKAFDILKEKKLGKSVSSQPTSSTPSGVGAKYNSK